MSNEPKPCPKCNAEGIVDTVVGILGERAVRCINHCSFNQTIFFTLSDWNALPREDDDSHKPTDELADMQPCPVCGGRCVQRRDWINNLLNQYHCENMCIQSDGYFIQTRSEWLALDRSKMPTPKKTAVVWVNECNKFKIEPENTGCSATIDITNPRLGFDKSCCFGEHWLRPVESIEEALAYIERVRLDKPTPKKTERWYQVKQALIITPGLGYGEDTMQYCDECAVAAENMEAARAMFSLIDKPKPEPVADCKPEVVVNHDPITAPDWYTWHPVAECRDITAFFPFHLGNAIKYIWRAGKKVDTLSDLMKAKEEIDNQILANKIEQLHVNLNNAFVDELDDDGEKDKEDGDEG